MRAKPIRIIVCREIFCSSVDPGKKHIFNPIQTLNEIVIEQPCVHILFIALMCLTMHHIPYNSLRWRISPLPLPPPPKGYNPSFNPWICQCCFFVYGVEYKYFVTYILVRFFVSSFIVLYLFI